jgi:hypothetical protein
MAPSQTIDTELGLVVGFFLRKHGFADQAALTLRRALDEVVDGMRTGRWSIDNLEKTEKTYIGTKVEILFKFDFEIPDGSTLDTRIHGAEVDIKCTVLNNWMIPREAVNRLCLLVRIDEAQSRFAIGVIRATDAVLTAGGNRDGKRTLSAAGKSAIRWIVETGELPVNFLATLSARVRRRIFSHVSGQERVDELFRLVQGRIIPRVAIETVARQKDPMKRMRDARRRLRAEGILVLGHQDADPATARRHGLQVPKKGEAISTRA